MSQDGKLPPEEDRFYSNSVDLAKNVVHIVKDTNKRGITNIAPGLLDFCMLYIGGYDKKAAIVNFVKSSYPHWEQIRKKEVKFFAENAGSVFSQFPGGNVQAFGALYEAKDKEGKPALADATIETLWGYFHSLVKISIKFIYRERENKDYTEHFGKINPEKEASLWSLDLNPKAKVAS